MVRVLFGLNWQFHSTLLLLGLKITRHYYSKKIFNNNIGEKTHTHTRIPSFLNELYFALFFYDQKYTVLSEFKFLLS